MKRDARTDRPWYKIYIHLYLFFSKVKSRYKYVYKPIVVYQFKRSHNIIIIFSMCQYEGSLSLVL